MRFIVDCDTAQLAFENKFSSEINLYTLFVMR